MLNIPRWKSFLIISVCLWGILYSLPNLFSAETLKSMPSWMPKQQIVLGLDLQGGSQLLMEVDLNGALKDRMHALVDEVRTILRKEKFGYTNLSVQTDGDTPCVTFSARDLSAVQEIKKILHESDRNIEIVVSGDVFKLTYTDHYIKERNKSIMEQSIGIITKRVDEDGTKEPTIQRQGDNRILIQLPGVSNIDQVKQILNRTAKMTFQMVDENASVEDALKGKIAPHNELAYGEKKLEGSDMPYILKKQIVISGENLVDASVGMDDRSGVVVHFKFDSIGARKFGLATRENVGKRFAIVLDNKVISAPVINQAIEGGMGIISGRFNTESATELALLMRAGALPATLNFLSESTVGPDLGADSINSGNKATLLAVLFVMVFMLFAYSFFGILANIAVLFNIILLVAGMTFLQATLTLPGIAGIALTIGMAVDANVLIFERIKEELRNGRKILTAIDMGYNRAMATIVDSNVTTLFGAALLYMFATGPVKGFAVTLSLGIIISMFTAVSLTRLITSWWLKIAKPKKLHI